MRMAGSWLSFGLVLLLASCGDDDVPLAPVDSGMEDAGTTTTCEAPAELETGDPTGHPAPLAVGLGEARAGRLSAADLPVDPAGLGVWDAGDLVVANEHLAVIIEDVGTSDLYDPYGGGVVGIARMVDGAMVEPADLNEIIIGTGRFIVGTESVTVMADGSDGGAAIVRAVGPLVPIPFAKDFAEGLIAGEYQQLRAAVDYVLEPGSRYVDVRFEYLSPASVSTRVTLPLMLIFQKYRMPSFAAGFGYGAVPDSAMLDWIGFDAVGRTSFAWQRPGSTLSLFMEISGSQLFSSDAFIVAPCGRTPVDMGRIYVGGPGIDGAVNAVLESDGVTTRAISGTVTDATGAAQSGVQVHASDSARVYLTRAVTGEDGTYVLHVAADAAVQLSAHRRGDGIVGPLEVPASTSEQDIELAPVGVLRVRVTEDGEASPARIQILPSAALPPLPDAWGEAHPAAGRLHVVFSVDGDEALRVPPGEHQVIVSRGYEYELVTRDATVAAGETLDVDIVLERVVDTVDVMCGDFHLHTHRSPDSGDTGELKIAAALADGIEVPVRTDHDWVNDFEPVIAALGAEAHAFGLSGLELTTFSWGHFGMFPLAARPELPNAGAFPWVDRLPRDVFDEARGLGHEWGQPAVIVNHPRASGGSGSLSGFGFYYFDAVGYDPATGMVDRPELWDEDFRLLEVFNDGDFASKIDGPVRDWFSLLNGGRAVFAVGSSDSHTALRDPVGYPRTCVTVGVDTPAELRALGPMVVRDELLRGRSSVSGGIFVSVATPGGQTSGDTVEGANAREQVVVRVQAPSWVTVDQLLVWVNGELVETITLDESTEDPTNPVVRFDDVVEFDVPMEANPSWVVVVASGPDDLAPVHPGRRPFAASNPIFFARE